MIQKIKDEINTFLENTIDINYTSLYFNISNIIYKHAIYDSMIICDNTNNTSYSLSQNFTNIDIYLKEAQQSDATVLNIVLRTDERRMIEIKRRLLKRKRKEKLNKIYDGL